MKKAQSKSPRPESVTRLNAHVFRERHGSVAKRRPSREGELVPARTASRKTHISLPGRPTHPVRDEVLCHAVMEVSSFVRSYHETRERNESVREFANTRLCLAHAMLVRNNRGIRPLKWGSVDFEEDRLHGDSLRRFVQCVRHSALTRAVLWNAKTLESLHFLPIEREFVFEANEEHLQGEVGSAEDALPAIRVYPVGQVDHPVLFHVGSRDDFVLTSAGLPGKRLPSRVPRTVGADHGVRAIRTHGVVPKEVPLRHDTQVKDASRE